MYEQPMPQGEYHHFQLVSSDGDIPVSISVLVHFGTKRQEATPGTSEPISANDIIAFHEGLKTFDGDFIKAFKSR